MVVHTFRLFFRGIFSFEMAYCLTRYLVVWPCLFGSLWFKIYCGIFFFGNGRAGVYQMKWNTWERKTFVLGRGNLVVLEVS